MDSPMARSTGAGSPTLPNSTVTTSMTSISVTKTPAHWQNRSIWKGGWAQARAEGPMAPLTRPTQIPTATGCLMAGRWSIAGG